jgi:CPA2 family monovalent cation:H+ antiporter-2
MIVEEADPLKIVSILTAGFVLASIFGYLSQKIKFSPILGYLLAGYVIGPFFSGFVADLSVSEQLAEIGVVLMMFGVGLHFKWQDLMYVKNIAIPGAIGQTAVTVLFSTFVIHWIGWPWQAGIIIGLSIGVASTVVLVRVLIDQKLLATPQGHIAVGWLIVEDILTVIALVMLPTIAGVLKGNSISAEEIGFSIIVSIFKFFLLATLMFTFGQKIVSFILFKIARIQSQELFTLTVLALIFLIASGSTMVFGTSIALGAFIAGMVIGQTDVKHQASAYSSPLKDVFVVIFFLAVGMLFNPQAIMHNLFFFLSILAIILLIKPLAAFVIVILLRYSMDTAFVIAIALAQIGEFSFILAEEANKLNVFPDEGYDVIVGCALISISINPLLFKLKDFIKKMISKKPIDEEQESTVLRSTPAVKALVIGFGKIGQEVAQTLEKIGFHTMIIDRDIDAIASLIPQKKAICGDASIPNLLEAVHIKSFNVLVITIPDIKLIEHVINSAQQMHSSLTILTRVKYSKDRSAIHPLGVHLIYCEEEEIKKAFDKTLFRLAERFFSHK